MSGTAYMTGVKELDAKLAAMPRKVQMKYGRKALRNAAKIVKEEFQRRVPIDTGAMRDALIVRAAGKVTDRKTGQLRRRRGTTGISLTITRDSLERAQQRHTAAALRKGGLKVKAKEVDVKFRGFYPAFVELGYEHGEGKRPLTKALYESEQTIRNEFIRQLTQLITSGGK